MRIAFHCGCGTVIQVDPTAVGRWIRCPVCRRKISRSELQGPRARLITEAEPGVSSGPAGNPAWVAPAQPSLPWKWIGAAAASLLLLLLGLLGLSLWEHVSSKFLASAEKAEKEAASSRAASQEQQQPAAGTQADREERSGTTASPSKPESRADSLPRPASSPPSQVSFPPKAPPDDSASSAGAGSKPSAPSPSPRQTRPLVPPAADVSADSRSVSWQRVVDRKGAFEILFPQGRISREQTAGVYGPLFMQLALTRWGEFRVIYTDFPQSVPLQGMNDVQRAFGPMLQELYGPLQGYPRPIQLHGFPGMVLRFAKGNKQTLAHVFLVRRRVYLVLWTGSAQPPWLDRFFASFDLPWARR